MLSAIASRKLLSFLEAFWPDSLLQLLHLSMSGRLCRPLKAAWGSWKCICSDTVVGVIGSTHRPMLRSHYNRAWTSEEWWGGRQWRLFPSILLLLLRSLNINWQFIFLTDDFPMFSWRALCLSFRAASQVPANEKKERPLSTMSEASNYTGGLDCAANPSSPAGRVSDTHEDRIILHICRVSKIMGKPIG